MHMSQPSRMVLACVVLECFINFLVNLYHELLSWFAITSLVCIQMVGFLGWFLSQHALLQWPRSYKELLCYVSKRNKLVQLVVQVKINIT